MMPWTRTLARALLLGLLLAGSSGGMADNMLDQRTLMVRTALDFERALGAVQQTLEEYGYSVAHIQRCDGGMSDFGYETDFYRVVFFGKVEEVRALSDRHPELAPFLPLKVLVAAERDESVLIALNPLALSAYFPDEDLAVQFARWYSDITAILEELRTL